MHIGVVTTSYPRFHGDPSGQFVRGLNRYLEGQGHRVEVLAAGDAATEHLPDVLRISSRLFYRGGAPDALSDAPLAWLAALGFGLRLGRKLASREASYDALISHWLLPCGLLSALLAPGKPHVAIAHSSDVHLLRRTNLDGFAAYIAERARLVYTSPSLRIPGAPGVVSPMGIDVAAFSVTSEERAAARQRLSLNAPTVLFLGRLVPVKGVAVLIEALRQTPRLHLIIAGDGPLRSQLAAAAAPLGARVRFVGTVDETRRREFLAACDALALPSLLLEDGRSEGAPQVILEGLAAGCSVVASAVGGVPSLLTDSGRLLPPGDAAALAAALDEAVRDDDAQRAAAVRAAARFDWSVVGPRILGDALTVPRGR